MKETEEQQLNAMKNYDDLEARYSTRCMELMHANQKIEALESENAKLKAEASEIIEQMTQLKTVLEAIKTAQSVFL